MTEAVPVQEIAALKIDAKSPASNGSAANGSAAPTSPVPAEGAATLKSQFTLFCKFGDVKSDGKVITLSQSDKWMKQAGVIDKKITTVDTGIHFKKLKSLKLSFADYGKFLEDLAKTKDVELADIKAKLAGCGTPGSNSGAKASTKAAETVARLTDASKYTGSSKQRFDDSGKGKGISGRKDVPDGSGYVAGYQHKDSYDKTH